MAEDAITAKEHCECGEGGTEVIELVRYKNLLDELEKCYDYDRRVQKIIETKIKLLKCKSGNELKVDALEEILEIIKEII